MPTRTARVAALQAGDVDLIEYVPWQSMAASRTIRSCAADDADGPFMYLTFNGEAGPFDDPRVRLAVAHAIKRDEIVKAAFFGRGSPIEGPPLAKGTPFYDAKLADGWAYDPAKAKSLLAAGGLLASGFSLQAAVDRAIRHAQGHRRRWCSSIWRRSASRPSWCCPTGRHASRSATAASMRWR